MSDQDVITHIVKPLLSEYEEGLLRQTLEACREATQSAYPVAKRKRAETAAAVLAVANASLAALPAELATSVAESVAHEVRTGGHDGTKGSCRLTWGCVVLRKNRQLRLMTLTGGRLKGVRVREKDEASLAGMRLVRHSYLMPDNDGGFLLKLSLAPLGAPSGSNGSGTPSVAAPIPQPASPESCRACGGTTLELKWDGVQFDWYCDACKSYAD